MSAPTTQRTMENARVKLDAGDIEHLAALIADRLSLPASRTPLVGVNEVAAYLGVEAGWVYEHAGELGVRRLGSGPKAPLRFSLEEIDERLSDCLRGSRSSGQDLPQTQRPRRRPRPGRQVVPNLLPIRGSNPASEAA
jgi:hypothetical protein